MISFTTSGSTARTHSFLSKLESQDLYSGLDALAKKGVTALQAATPIDSGLTSGSWGYEIEIGRETSKISWINTNSVDGVNVAIILQYGHATGTGGWVSGRDYINPALKPIFDEIAENVWRKVTSA